MLPAEFLGSPSEATFPCNLSIRAVAASVPALARQENRPWLEVALGDVCESTEFAVLAPQRADFPGSAVGECPRRFCNTLTFVVRHQEVLRAGLRLRLCVGGNRVRPSELGQAWVDLRRQALQDMRRCGAEVWESPEVRIPLVCSSSNSQEYVALVFCVDADPQKVCLAVDADARTVRDVVASYGDIAEPVGQDDLPSRGLGWSREWDLPSMPFCWPQHNRLHSGRGVRFLPRYPPHLGRCIVVHL